MADLRISDDLALPLDLDTYHRFLARKALVVRPAGITVSPDAVHPRQLGHQRVLTQWMLGKGRAACFAATGLGKAGMAIEGCRLTGQRSLILTPLGVVQQFVDEGRRLDVEVTAARQQSEAHPTGITVANYDRLHLFNLDDFGCLVADESSCLKHEDAKIGTRLIEASRDIPFRFAYSATPAPNDHAELARHAEFLGVMERREVLATFFVHANKADGSKGQEWRLKGHARAPFYRWLASWGMTLKRPSDLGFSDAGYALPPLTIRPVIVKTDWTRPGELFASELKGIQDRSAVRRATFADRVGAALELIRDEPDEQRIIWCGLNDEQNAIAAALGDRCVSISGSMAPEDKIAAERRWRRGDVRYLVSKVSIFGYGMNWQHCARMTFVGLSDSYEQYHQGIRRIWAIRPATARPCGRRAHRARGSDLRQRAQERARV
jgi:hypothetical protein